MHVTFSQKFPQRVSKFPMKCKKTSEDRELGKTAARQVLVIQGKWYTFGPFGNYNTKIQSSLFKTAYLDLPVLALCLKTGMIMSGLRSQKRCGAGQRGRTDKDSYVKRLMTGIKILPCSTESSSHKEEAALLSLWGLAAVSCRSQANKSVKKKGG